MSASRTALYVAFYRALEHAETRRPPLFRDPFAAGFLPRGMQVAVRLSRLRPLRAALERYVDGRAPGARSSAIGRTRFIDDVVRRECARGVDQLVVLGAGYDCRAHRLAELRGVKVFEVDRADTQAVKQSRMRGAPGARPDVAYVALDFARDDVGARLVAAGWGRERQAVFVWEGVTNYLEPQDISRVLRLVGGSAAGSALAFTYVHRGVIDGSVRFEGGEQLLGNVRRLGEPWKFGLLPAEVGDFLAPFGLALEQDVGADEYRTRYLGGAGRDLRGYAFYRVAVARVAGNAERRSG